MYRWFGEKGNIELPRKSVVKTTNKITKEDIAKVQDDILNLIKNKDNLSVGRMQIRTIQIFNYLHFKAEFIGGNE